MRYSCLLYSCHSCQINFISALPFSCCLFPKKKKEKTENENEKRGTANRNPTFLFALSLCLKLSWKVFFVFFGGAFCHLACALLFVVKHLFSNCRPFFPTRKKKRKVLFIFCISNLMHLFIFVALYYIRAISTSKKNSHTLFSLNFIKKKQQIISFCTEDTYKKNWRKKLKF